MCHFVLKGTPKNHVNRGVIKEGPVGIIKKNDSLTPLAQEKSFTSQFATCYGEKGRTWLENFLPLTDPFSR
jgi:hypothetical protein